MAPRAIAGLDRLTLACLLAGAVCLAFAIVGAIVLISPPTTYPSASEGSPTPAASPTDVGEVATILYVDAAAGAGSATRSGDHIDVLGYFPRASTGTQSVTRLILQDVPVLGVSRAGDSIALTLGLTQDAAVMLQEAQALGARPYVALRSAATTTASDGMPASFSDADLAARVGTGTLGATPTNDR